MIDNQLVSVQKTKRLIVIPFYKRIGGTEYPLLVVKPVLDRLLQVSESIPEEYKLQVDSGYRTPETQAKLWRSWYLKYKKKYPKKSDLQIKYLVRKLVTNPEYDYSPHTTGAAVDVTLTDKKGREINLSAPFSKYYSYPKLRSSKISNRSQELRLMLNRLMLEQGFAPLLSEYWHFSYGDKIWAEYYKKGEIFKQIPSISDKHMYSILQKNIRLIIKHVYHKYIRFFKIKINY